jgi:eukaryotic-like serine/threonine-protein kinase
MNDRLAKAEALFHDALALPPEQRDTFLQSACAADADLLAEVSALLRAAAVADQWLKDQPREGAVPPAPERPGTLIGRYKLLEKIGEGGFGVVYMAEQREPIRRRVALKVIKLGMDTGSVIARFEAERQALAIMDHPNIAKVLDAGATDTGRPYFVMELVRGIRITDYCDRNNLSTNERILLFIQICQAVQHAHQKGIIHRDLKPSNILVTLHDGLPVPKVIDFGIAKATGGQRLTDNTLFTAFEQFIGTPAYMSPEQAEMSGLDIDTRTDIYALGVLLYELLTGKTPFNAKELMAAGLDEIRRTIREREPARPSTRLSTMLEGELTYTARHRRTDPPKLIHLVRGDLDWMVMKCLEKDRTRRYETASALAVDIQRHLNNEPVLARPPSKLYRFQKLVRRNKLTFAAGSAVAVALIVGLGLSTWLFLRERTALKVADANARRADQKAQESRRNLYAADMILAQAALEAGNIGRAKELLTKHLPNPGEKDLRGWEWRYAWNQCRSDELFTLKGHTLTVTSLALSADAKKLASGGKDGKVIVWDLEKSTSAKILEHGANIFGVAFSNEDKELIVGAGNGRIFIWNCETWQRIKILTNLSRLRSLRVSPDRKILAGFGVGSLVLWNLADFREVAKFKLRVSNDLIPGGIAFSPDSSVLAYSRGDGVIVLWDLANAKWLAELEGHERCVSALAFSWDGSILVSGSRDRTVRVWDVTSRKELRQLGNFPGWVGCVTFSPAGEFLAVVGAGQRIRLFDTRTWQEIQSLTGHSEELWTAVFSPDGRTIMTGSKDGTIKCWGVSTNREPTWQRLPPDVRAFALLADAKNLYLTHTNHTYSLWRTDPFQQTVRHPFQLPRWTATTVSPNGKFWTAGTTNGLVKVFDHSRDRFIADLYCASSAVSKLAFSADGRMLAAAGGDHACQVWSVASLVAPNSNESAFQEKAVLGISARSVEVLKFSRNGRLLGIVDQKGITEIWSIESGLKVGTVPGHQWMVKDIDFSPDDSTIATASADGRVRLWDLNRMRESAVLPGQLHTTFSVAFSPDKTRLAACGGDGIVRLWDMETKQEVASLKIHTYPLNQLAFSTDDDSLIVLDSATLGDGRLFVLRAPRD